MLGFKGCVPIATVTLYPCTSGWDMRDPKCILSVLEMMEFSPFMKWNLQTSYSISVHYWAVSIKSFNFTEMSRYLAPSLPWQTNSTHRSLRHTMKTSSMLNWVFCSDSSHCDDCEHQSLEWRGATDQAGDPHYHRTAQLPLTERQQKNSVPQDVMVNIEPVTALMFKHISNINQTWTQ